MPPNPRGLPPEPPAVGGWYWDEKARAARFLMPPYPGVDDCVKVGGKWAYRRLVERDRQKGVTDSNALEAKD